MEERESSFQNLYKKMDATSKTRFNASRRLKLHSMFSTYIIVFISLGLILVTLMQAYSLGSNINNKIVGLFQAFSSIAVLVYSLLIDRNDYSSTSEKMYSCAAQLGELKQEVRPYLAEEEHDEDRYLEFKDKYHQLLKLYETHSNNDFRGDYYRAKLEMPEDYEIKGLDWLSMHFKIIVSHILDFISYFVVISVLLSVLYWITFGEPFSIAANHAPSSSGT
ncbi:SLATT domain-containing protein [Vibrio diabolicus]|uniref:SLATT domain-containing protein n=1 Tax=Vibrio diabolicus TaxID=50719 RepID=UPI00232C61BF|nr:SLATT domain-containing protein [Vibrio diabolicus]